jgi:hypothetical protein
VARSLSTRTRKYALIGGVASIPLAVASYAAAESAVSLAPVTAGVVAGYLARRDGVDTGGVGFRAGLLAALPSLALLSDVLVSAAGLAGPGWFVATGALVAVGFLASVAVLVFGLSALFGELGGRIGGWLAGV